MSQASKSVAVLFVSSILSISFIGCDKLGLGSKKEVKEPPKSEVPKEVPVVAKENSSAKLPADVVVRLGSWVLTNDELNQRIKLLKQGLPDFNDKDPNTKRMVVDELIRQQLLVKDAEESDIGKQKDIQDAVEDFRKTLLVQEVANRLTKDIAVTEAEALAFYNDKENKPQFIEPVTYKVREIVVEDEVAANNLLVQILQGSDFAALAQAQSKGKTAAKGGEIKEFTRAPFEAMQKAIASVEVGKTSTVFKGPQGFYIVKVDSKKGGEAKPFADIKTQLISGLTLRKQQQAVMEHLNKLAEKTKIEVNEELLGKPEGDGGKPYGNGK